tara:strand:- start:1493 stop:2521 length:1029 start_codon:yes stop_codon:yes gene_type:complete
MKKQILIFGAGSIGNHFANACSKLKYNTFVTDISEKALKRMKDKIYPTRYKKWNNNIKLIYNLNLYEVLNKNKFDLVIIGTPPSTHFEIFKKIKSYNIKNILIEKPLCSFSENPKFFMKYNAKSNLFCGYNHSISKSFNFFTKKILNKKIKLIKITWNENWEGILNAHFWMKDEFDSYLGNYKRGGGATQEHSHGLHLLITLTNLLNIKIDLKKIQKNILFKTRGKIKYDNYLSMFLKNEKTNFFLETNLLDSPTNKSIIAYHENGFTKYLVNFKQGNDAVIQKIDKKEKIYLFKKDRTSEFLNEVKHIFSLKNDISYKRSNINIKRGIETLNLIKFLFLKT